MGTFLGDVFWVKVLAGTFLGIAFGDKIHWVCFGEVHFGLRVRRERLSG